LYCRTQAEAAEYAGVCTRVVRRWKNERGLPVTSQGWYIKKMLDIWKKNDAGGGGAAMVEHRQRETIAQAGIKEYKEKLLALDLELKRGEYHGTAECEAKGVRKLVDLTRGIEAMRRKVEARVPPEVRAMVSRILKEEIKQMRQQFARD